MNSGAVTQPEDSAHTSFRGAAEVESASNFCPKILAIVAIRAFSLDIYRARHCLDLLLVVSLRGVLPPGRNIKAPSLVQLVLRAFLCHTGLCGHPEPPALPGLLTWVSTKGCLQISHGLQTATHARVCTDVLQGDDFPSFL